MKRKQLFFIFLFVIGLVVGLFYLHDFLDKQHPSLDNKLTTGLILVGIAAIAIQLLAHFTRAYKSHYLLDGIRRSKTRTLFNGVAVGFLFNALLPFRLGEFIRAYYVGDALAISKTAVFISIIIERVVDGFILGVCFISAALLIKGSSLDGYSTLMRFGLILLIVSSILSFVIYLIRSENKYLIKTVSRFSGLFNESISNRMRFMGWSGIYGTRLMLSNRRSLGRYLIFSGIMWILYFSSTALISLAYFGNLHADKTWYVTQSTYAGVSAPAGPGYIGTFHLIVTRLLNDIGLLAASGYASISWLIMVIPISLIGVFVLIRQRFKDKAPAHKEDMLINKLHREHNISGELAHFLDAYFKGEKINQILTHAELSDKFKMIKSFRGGSNAHTMLVWQNDVRRVKKIALPQYADKLEEQAKWLLERAGLKNLPKVVGQEKTEHHYFYDLEYREEFYPFFEYIHSNSPEKSFQVLKKVINFMNKSVYKPSGNNGHKQKLQDYIDGKVVQKTADTASISNAINKLMRYKKLEVNGVEYHNLAQMIDKIQSSKKVMRDLADYQESPIHGDLTVDNLIVNNKGDFLLLDPNNENQVSTRVVDFGKLHQSLHSGYEFLIQLENCTVNRNKISFEDSKSHKYAQIFNKLDKELKSTLPIHEYNAILFHEAVHYCRMLTYRVNINPTTVPIFYGTAVKLFGDFLRQYE